MMVWLQKISTPMAKTSQVHEDDEGFVDDPSGRTFWGSRGSGTLFVRINPTLGPQVLAVQRSSRVEEPYTWGTSGGAVPKGETDLLASAIRETTEELGSFPSHYNMLKTYSWSQPGGSFTYTTYIMQVMDEWTPRNFNYEVSAARWVSIEDARQLDLHFGLSDLLDSLGDSIFSGEDN